MVQKIKETDVKYIIVQKDLDSERELGVYFYEPQGTLTTVEDFNQATRFDDVEMLSQLVHLQNEISKVMKNSYQYVIYKEDITRTSMM